ELFGHEKGAFTGAQTAREGLFRAAHGGTLFLDEISELPLALQVKLLRVLQERRVRAVGATEDVEVDVRVIAATNRDLEKMMQQGTFREDLYYRLQVIEVHIPPLRERREEIPQLIEFFLLKYSSVYRRPPTRPSLVLQEALLSYEWPGNIRELENMIKRFVVLQDETLILSELGRLRAARALAESEQSERSVPQATSTADHRYPPPPAPASRPMAPPPAPAYTMPAPVVPPEPVPSVSAATAAMLNNADGVNLQELARTAAMGAEKEAIQHALERFRWNRRKTAEYLQVSYKTLLNKMKECGISESPGA
ncbi:MAG TPA: sigma 54-interacting transcriptional regulator, partial [Vicinamibacterales bacterium]|nr:sigma 54-interacting transcriptional regulator [Vicinamibacterales bacterium]